MINADLHPIHIGQAIKKRVEELNMTKTQFGNLIGVQQQHVNRIFERETMETKKLVKVCEVLDYNFFALFCRFPTKVNAYLAAVALGDGDANNNVGEAAVLAQMEKIKAENAGLVVQNTLLSDQVSQLKANLADKDEIISLYKKNCQ